MLGRKTYERDELALARSSLREQLNAWDALAKATTDAGAQEAVEAFEPAFFNGLAMVLDRFFVHRARLVAGKDDNALNELELLTESLMNNHGVFRAGTVLTYDPGSSIAGYAEGDPVALDRDTFERLSDAFFAVLEERFVR